MIPLSKNTLRSFLKDSIRKQKDFSQTDQARGMPPPAIEKAVATDAERIDLIAPNEIKLPAMDLKRAVLNRKSHRHFREACLSGEALSFLLWATQGVREWAGPSTALRTVPSAGARHALETYVLVFNVENFKEGIYRYLPAEHQLVFLQADNDLRSKTAEGAFNQQFAGKGAVTFVWTAMPYRMEWRYGLAAHKVILLDAGHVCQNLYLACEAIGAGTCAIAAYDQEKMDTILGVDGEEEFVIYMAPVGKV